MIKAHPRGCDRFIPNWVKERPTLGIIDYPVPRLRDRPIPATDHSELSDTVETRAATGDRVTSNGESGKGPAHVGIGGVESALATREHDLQRLIVGNAGNNRDTGGAAAGSVQLQDMSELGHQRGTVALRAADQTLINRTTVEVRSRWRESLPPVARL
jgi:hypothetical protein